VNTEPVVFDGAALSIEEVVEVAREHREVKLGDHGRSAVVRSHQIAGDLVIGDRAVYGLSTGFGALAERYIEPDRRGDLQTGLVRSHAATAGAEIDNETVRAMMTLRAGTLAKGYSGVRPEVVEAIIGLLNHRITPVVREHGSLGCSGDLAPLAHVGLALIGEGEVKDRSGQRVAASKALTASGLRALRLEAKEGLALINGTDGMLGILCLACFDLGRLLRASDVAAAMSVEALLGTDQAFLPELIELRPHPGQAASAANLLSILGGSEIVASHRMGDTRVQDAYSLRCAPQILGACRDTLAHTRAVVDRELDSAVDNPVVLLDGRVASCGNFHGAPLAYVADFLAIAIADAASAAERRIDRHLDPARSHGLPAFLAADPGVDSGLMLAHYTAAALAADCRRLALPASCDNIPTSAMQEDHVSMGWAAARKLRHSIDNLERVVAIEVMTAARAIELRAPLRPAAATASVLAGLRESVPGMGQDRYVAPEIDLATDAVREGRVVGWAESVAGRLQ
jgi:histidine ammonia-lyase